MGSAEINQRLQEFLKEHKSSEGPFAHKNHSQVVTAEFLGVIAYQLAVMNERNRKQAEDEAEAKRTSRQTAGHKEKTAAVRKNSKTMYFRPSSWNVEVPIDDLRQFNPNQDQPELQDLEIGAISIGTLGTKSDVEVKRTR